MVFSLNSMNINSLSFFDYAKNHFIKFNCDVSFHEFGFVHKDDIVFVVNIQLDLGYYSQFSEEPTYIITVMTSDSLVFKRFIGTSAAAWFEVID